MPHYLSEKDRITILMMIGYGDRVRTHEDVHNLFNATHPEHQISRSTVSRIDKKFRETGSVKDKLRTGRPTINGQIKTNVLLSAIENPHINVRSLGDQYNIGKSSISNIFNAAKYHPYKVRLVHELAEDDFDRRTEFCEIMMAKCDENPDFSKYIIFSDEATFYLSGHVNRQNVRYWSDTNPHWIQTCHTQHPQKVNVWVGIVQNRVVGPYFFDQNLTGQLYLEFLQNRLIPDLIDLFPEDNNINQLNILLWFQQDGAPPHYARAVRNYLDAVFPNKWIGRRGAIEWPARSPDLTPLDYFLWGYLKSKVYVDRPENLDSLKERISLEMSNITEDMLQNVKEEFYYRLGYCQQVNGGQFQHLIK